ncbi:uncharacterized protein EDB93DRAFT_1250246 [Suillus bovinus]|uniref:uncharacterized protein n=1 Tax=Suillus bovinus TaxID=48563 RepID=UPI001B881301|nr:uncharacterized protein EDB93DRAFT_1250246 [Suillus bovinus]KAG2148178.1 hypothetical protein EDB93DRAFT_1250246 [Suillus bovinus]
MNPSLVFSALVSITVLAMTYPVQAATIAKRSYMEDREDFGGDLIQYYKYDGQNHRESDADEFN